MINQKRIMLLVTENCNLKCTYCYEHQKNKKKMSFVTAKAIIDKHLVKCNSNETVVIEVFGGEAFENFPLIKEIEEYISNTYSDLNVIYETTTNGTLIHGNVQEWLSKHKKQFFIALSLDGNKEIHDVNRVFENGKGSFDSIDIEFFANTWPGCPAKMTISEKTLPYLAQGVKYLDGLGFKCDATLSVGVDWNAKKYIPILIEQLNELVEYYTDNPNKKICTLLDMDFRLVLAPIDDDYRFCGAGIDMMCYDTLGNAYPCQGFAPVSIGDDAKEYCDFDEKEFRFNEENFCKRCPWVRLCPNCYAANFQSTGNIQLVDKNLCELYKLCILASSKIQFNRILQKDEITRDDQLVLKAISMVQDGIK